MSDGAFPRHADIDLTENVAERYRARGRVALDRGAARADLARLVLSGKILEAASEWARSAGTKPFDLVIGDALTLSLAAQDGRWVTTTCLVKTTLTERRREERTRQKARRADAKRARRRASW